MPNNLYRPVVGIDVSSSSSTVCILSPNGDFLRKSFKITHTYKGFMYLQQQIKKVENMFSIQSAIFMESTGNYHLPLLYFLQRRNFNTFVLNPLTTNYNKNCDIRKVKTDSADAIKIAKLGKYQDVKVSSPFDSFFYSIKILCREYSNLVDSRAQFKKKLRSELIYSFPGYTKIFSDITGVSSVAILTKYPTADAVIEASEEEIIMILKESSRRSISWCQDIYKKLIEAANEAKYIAIPLLGTKAKIISFLSIIQIFDKNIDSLLTELQSIVQKAPAEFTNNIELLQTIPGIAFTTAAIIISEIGDFSRFKSSKQLVAYFGINPSVKQSGEFNSTKNRMSKRGSYMARKAIFHIAVTSISTRKKVPINKVLLEYYNSLKNKPKKVALGALMNKITKYIFSVLTNKIPYMQRPPRVHQIMFLYKNKVA